MVSTVQNMEALRAELISNCRLIEAAAIGPIYEPQVELGGTFFHLSHQGFNDAVAMRHIGSALRAAVPALNFVAPHLRGPRSVTLCMHPFLSFIMFQGSRGRSARRLGRLNPGGPQLWVRETIDGFTGGA